MTERKKLSAEDCLNRITPPTPSRRFLQWFDTDHKELWFGLGSGDHALQISSGRKLELYDKAEDISPSRLMKETVLSFRSDGGHVTGRVLFEQCRAFQERYLYFKDERLCQRRRKTEPFSPV